VDARQSRTRAQLLRAHRQRQHLHFKTTTQSIDSHFISEQLDQPFFAYQQTNSRCARQRPHTAKAVQERRPIWERGLTLFYLPPYSPHSSTWLKSFGLKYEWLRPHDYLSQFQLTCTQALHCRLVAHHQLLNHKLWLG